VLLCWLQSIQNEPLNNPPWEGCIYSATEQVDFLITYLHPALHAHFPHLKLLAWDFNKDGAVEWVTTQFANKTAAALFWGVSLHWYAGALLDQMDLLHSKFPSQRLIATESCICPDVHLDEWARGELYAGDIIGDLNHWSVGYTDWNLLLAQDGGPTHVGESCDSAVIARFDMTPVQLHYQPMFYAMGHFSRFLPRGSVRLHSELQTAAERTAAATPQLTTWLRNATHDGVRSEEVVVVLMNNDDVEQVLAVQAGKLYANLTVPPHSMHSITFPAALLTLTGLDVE
jgi:glucosylceramidase